MALDRWFPTKFAMLSDRLVTQKGILLMGGAALVTMVLTGGSVKYLVVLYSINVFITFFLSQLGMVRHWWQVRGKETHWEKKLFINGVGMTLTLFILISVTVLKFHEGGWITILLTGIAGRHGASDEAALPEHLRTAAPAGRTRRSCRSSCPIDPEATRTEQERTVKYDPQDKTAVLLVNGFNGLGLHTLFGIIRLFGGTFKNFVFIQVGVVDAGNFKGAEEVALMKESVQKELDRYVQYMRCHGYYASGVFVLRDRRGRRGGRVSCRRSWSASRTPSSSAASSCSRRPPSCPTYSTTTRSSPSSAGSTAREFRWSCCRSGFDAPRPERI